MAKASCSNRLLERSPVVIFFSDPWLWGDNELGDKRDAVPPPTEESVADVKREGDLTLVSKLQWRSITTRTGIFGRAGKEQEMKRVKEIKEEKNNKLDHQLSEVRIKR